MGLPSNREVGFVGITVQDSGRLIFNSHYGEADDTWVVTVSITIFFFTRYSYPFYRSTIYVVMVKLY